MSCEGLSVKKRITAGTREWADHNVNCVLGCYNNCKYCYAKVMAKRFGRATDETWSHMVVRQKIKDKSYKKFSGRVMFPSSHDIIDFPTIEEACFNTLNRLLESRNEVLITTKPRISIIKKIDKLFEAYKNHLQFRFTITSINNALLSFWEPNAPSFEERLEALKFAFGRQYKTSVSIEPFLDRQPLFLIKRLQPFCTESIWIGKMNYIAASNIRQEDMVFYENIRENYKIDNIQKIYSSLKDIPKIRFKDSILLKLAHASSNS